MFSGCPGRSNIGFTDEIFHGDTSSTPYLESIENPIVIISPDGTIQMANAAFLQLLRASREDIIGRDFKTVEPLNSLNNTVSFAILKDERQEQRIYYGNLTLDAQVKPLRADDDTKLISIFMRDVTAFVNMELELLRKNRELTITNILTKAFISSGDINTVFADLLDKALVVSNLNIGWVMMKHEGGFDMKVSNGLPATLDKKIMAGVLDGLYEDALRSDSPIYVLEPDDIQGVPELRDEGIAFFSLVPFRVGEETYGFIVLASKKHTDFNFELASILSLIGNNLSLIAEKISLFQETQRLAITDGLTGLYNVRHFYELLDMEILRTERYSLHFTLALFDIDDFKSLNDTYGHQAGDEVLREVSDTILSASRKTDVVARYGGEEFIILLPNTDKADAFHQALRIKNAVEAKRYLGKEALRLTLSGGIAAFPGDAKDSKSLLYAADMAMYGAKADGKSRIRIFGQESKEDEGQESKG